MNIAMIGMRGVPANYGGFETCVEELGKRLVEKGHKVVVYCRSGYYTERPESYLGMNLVHLPNINMRSLDTLSHTFLSVIHALRRSYDVLMVFNAANSPALIIPRLVGKRIVINTDGLEWKRGKWGGIGRRYYKFAEWLSTRLASRIVSDSSGIQDYYRTTYNTESTSIAYGAYITTSSAPVALDKIGVRAGEYCLQITRFEPENNPLLTIRAYKKLKTDKKLVVVGGVPYPSGYSRQVFEEAGAGVILPGSIYEKELLNELWCNCYAYIHGNEVGGTNPALLQAMASGCFVIARDVVFNRDVLQDCGLYFGKDDGTELARQMQWALDHSDHLEEFKKKAKMRIQEQYSWDRITDQYEELFRSVCTE